MHGQNRITLPLLATTVGLVLAFVNPAWAQGYCYPDCPEEPWGPLQQCTVNFSCNGNTYSAVINYMTRTSDCNPPEVYCDVAIVSWSVSGLCTDPTTGQPDYAATHTQVMNALLLSGCQTLCPLPRQGCVSNFRTVGATCWTVQQGVGPGGYWYTFTSCSGAACCVGFFMVCWDPSTQTWTSTLIRRYATGPDNCVPTVPDPNHPGQMLPCVPVCNPF